MSRYTKEDIFRLAKEENVKYIRLQFTDLFRVIKKRRDSSETINESS